MMVNGPLELKLDERNMQVLVIILHRFSDLHSWLHYMLTSLIVN